MTSANSEIRATYDYEDAKEIVNHGCESGVCFKHIYYADTIEFFTKYPDEITSYIVDNIGIDFMKETLGRNNGELDGYLNDLTWAFIELVAGEIVEDYEYTTCEEMDDEPIKLYANYSEDEVQLLQKNGFNPQRSMNESRYSQV